MTPSILVWWWLFLVAAVLVTLVDVYLLMRVINLSRQISLLSRRALSAAPGIAANTAAGEELSRLVPLITRLVTKADDLGALTRILGERLTRNGR